MERDNKPKDCSGVSLAYCIVIQWKPLNVITDNVIIRLMGSNFSCLSNPKSLLMCNSFAYCYHLVNVISLAWSQSDHIKRLPLYYSISIKIQQTKIYLNFCGIFQKIIYKIDRTIQTLAAGKCLYII